MIDAPERRAERRLITCLFLDIVGSTGLTMRLTPERLQRALDEAFGALREIVHAALKGLGFGGISELLSYRPA